jgi:hypothetical protein
MHVADLQACNLVSKFRFVLYQFKNSDSPPTIHTQVRNFTHVFQLVS